MVAEEDSQGHAYHAGAYDDHWPFFLLQRNRRVVEFPKLEKRPLRLGQGNSVIYLAGGSMSVRGSHLGKGDVTIFCY